jgi:MurNAc alpha-1-phosphate uridylyltransferase
MGVTIETAMLLAAGYGTRMMPLTADRPKPMLPVAGKPMIDHALDKCVAAGVRRAVINLHYKGEAIENHLKNRRDIEIIFSREPELLDSGGGVKQALQYLGDAPFYCFNTDLVFTDAATPALQQLSALWDDATMDLLMLMKETDSAVGFDSARGDYHMRLTAGRFGIVYGRAAPPPKPYVFSSVFIVHPRVYAPFTATVFSNRDMFDNAEMAGRFYGLVHDGGVYHASTPADLERVNALLSVPQSIPGA